MRKSFAFKRTVHVISNNPHFTAYMPDVHRYFVALYRISLFFLAENWLFLIENLYKGDLRILAPQTRNKILRIFTFSRKIRISSSLSIQERAESGYSCELGMYPCKCNLRWSHVFNQKYFQVDFNLETGNRVQWI